MSEQLTSNPVPKSPTIARRGLPRRRLLISGSLLLAAVLLGFFVIRRNFGDSHANPDTGAQIVAFVPVSREDLTEELTLTAEFKPFQEVSIHAKVAGFVQSISVDVGDHVTAGQIIAKLDVPELKHELSRASAELRASQADVRKAAADYQDDHLNFQRLLDVAKENPKLIARQELDTAKSKDGMLEAALASAKQRVEEAVAAESKTRDMVAYASIAAPFSGTITKRYADLGALVQAGTSSSTQAMPIVDLAEDDRLRLVFPVPESAVPRVHPGVPVEIAIQSLDKTITGEVARCSGKVDRATRTMEAEVDIPNPDHLYTPGMYASLKVTLQKRKRALAIPLQAVSIEKTATVLVMGKGNKLEERTVSLGLRTATKAEVLSGLRDGDQVAIGSRSVLQPGQKAVAKLLNLSDAD